MKRIYLIAAVICLALGAGACSKGQSQGTEAGETSAAAESEAGKEEETAAGTKEDAGQETSQESGSKEETTEEAKEQAVTGQVENVEKQVITINGYDGLEYQVDLSDADARSSLEVGEGDEIQVVFLESDDEIKKAQSYEIISSVALEGDMDPVIAGVIQEASGESVVIETAGRKTHTFSTLIAQIVTGEKGLAPGENVEITYLGKIDEGVAVRVITEEGSGNVEATYSALIGTLRSASDQAVVVETADGRQFTFAVGEYVDAMDYEIGETVEVTYEGSLAKQNAIVTGIDN